ncbi:hypothetical protein KC354_g7454 [Hortaea werneckii]|nr:hypothetical protein KC355_g9827 [Hortaea werneckii]KAI7362218.1 hypothetical protein KC354_g7454 [Hortaea werneckii]
MSRRGYPVADRYDERESDFYRRPRQDRNYDDIDIDIDINREREGRQSRAPPAPVKERDTVVSDRRTERPGPRMPDFMREDYGKSNAGPMVLRREERDDDMYSRAPTRRRSMETVRSRPPPPREEELVIRERDRNPPYPRSERGDPDVVFRERARSRGPPPSERPRQEDIDIDIDINRGESRSRAPPRSEAPSRSDIRERDIEEIRFRRGGGERPPPPRTEVDREEVRYAERHSPPPRSEYQPRGRGREDIDIDIDIHNHERSRAPPPRQRSMSRGALLRKEHEEWIIRRQKEREPSPPPPPRDFEKEEIVIRRRERSPTPEPPPKEPTPEPSPPPPPPPEPVYRPPIIQEVITHHRHYDHGVERVRSPSPPPAPSPPPPPPPQEREEDLEVAIHRQGIRNGRPYDENIDIDIDLHRNRSRSRGPSRAPSRAQGGELVRRPRSPSAGPPVSRSQRYDDEVAAEADYYNRKVRERAYPGEAWDGATRDWGLVDVPPGTERVRMDGKGGGRQDIYWERYNGERKGKFYAGDRVYESEFGNGLPASAPPPAPLPPPSRERQKGGNDIDIDINISHEEGRRRQQERDRHHHHHPQHHDEIRISERRIQDETHRGKTKDKMWTEITKDLVIREAVEEMGYEFEETEEFFYVIEYLKYEDVLRLVEISEDIRRERRDRLREIQWEREELERRPKMLPPPPFPPVPPAPKGTYDERIYERDVYYDREGRRWRR